MIHLTINEQAVEYEQPITILEAARNLGLKIPTLCYNEYIQPYGGCRLCLVEVATQKTPEISRLLPACCTYVAEGQIVRTDTEQVKDAQQFLMALYLARCPESEELQKLAREVGIPEDPNASNPIVKYLLTRTTPVFDTKCVLCGLCVRVCAEITERHAISFSKRGMNRKVLTPFTKVAETCIGCRSCAYVCPTNTITIEEVT